MVVVGQCFDFGCSKLLDYFLYVVVFLLYVEFD